MPDIHTSPNHYWSLKRQKLSLISSSSVPKFSITLLTVVVPSRLRILGIQHAAAHRLSLASILVPRCSSHICIQVFSYVADHLSLANNPLLQMHPLLANIIDQDHRILRTCLIHGLSLLSSTRYPVLSIILAIVIRLVQPSLYLPVDLR